MHNRASRWWGQKGQYCAKITNVCVSPKWDGSLNREGLFKDSAHMLFIVCFVSEFYTHTILYYTILFGWIHLALSWNCEPISKLLIIYTSSKYKSRYNYSSFSICLWKVYLAGILSATSTLLVLPYFKLLILYLFIYFTNKSCLVQETNIWKPVSIKHRVWGQLHSSVHNNSTCQWRLFNAGSLLDVFSGKW